ncbi:MAG: hypothetical protein KA028_03890 [Candidatus Pacebacteria bacterium]|nr:hypothetical protein [Candidatus Paceibacterota bacterium]MBP9851738.1 hypothetical protein [Candidatus Paceibacterota bacterium]
MLDRHTIREAFINGDISTVVDKIGDEIETNLDPVKSMVFKRPINREKKVDPTREIFSSSTPKKAKGKPRNYFLKQKNSFDDLIEKVHPWNFC